MRTTSLIKRLSGVWLARLTTLAIVSIVLVGLTSFVPNAQADTGFSNQTLRGD